MMAEEHSIPGMPMYLILPIQEALEVAADSISHLKIS
jgi:hypothetical protein